MKRFILTLIIVCNLCSCDFIRPSSSSSSSSSLEDRGYNFLANQMNSPTTLVLLGTVGEKETEGIFRGFGWQFEPYQKAIIYKVEGTNAYGGRITKTYIVFFVDKKPMDFVDAELIYKHNIENLKGSLQVNGFFK